MTQFTLKRGLKEFGVEGAEALSKEIAQIHIQKVGKPINGKQCTILWRVDDLKISHVDAAVNTEVIKLINKEFGKEAPLTINRGKIHDYLGMTLDFTEEGKVKIKMLDYVANMLAEAPDEMDGKAPTPAANHLFDVDEDFPLLEEVRAQVFHTFVVKTLFFCKRARPDLQTAPGGNFLQSLGKDNYSDKCET